MMNAMAMLRAALILANTQMEDSVNPIEPTFDF